MNKLRRCYSLTLIFFVLTEMSRIARSILQVLEILSACAEKEVNVYVAKQQMILDGSMKAKITATVLGFAAEIDREFIC